MSNSQSARRSRDRCDFRMTAAGLLLSVAALVMLAAALNTARALLFGVLGLTAGALLASVFVSRRMLRAVRVHRDLPRRVFANRVVHLGYRMTNRRGRSAVIGVELSEIDPPEAFRSVGAYCLYLPAGATFKSGSRFTASRRGRYELTRLQLSTRFPFSLATARRWIRQESSLTVWPSMGRLKEDLLAHGAAEMSDGAPSQVRSGADEFFGLRDYRQGDNLRWIHWRRTAAMGRPVVREMTKPRPDVLVIALDTALPKDSERGRPLREKLIRFAATLAEDAFRRDHRVGLALFVDGQARMLPPATGRGGRAALLDALAGIDDSPAPPFADILQLAVAGRARNTHVVAVGADADRLSVPVRLRAACGRLTVVGADRIDELFADDPNVRPDDRREGEP